MSFVAKSCVALLAVVLFAGDASAHFGRGRSTVFVRRPSAQVIVGGGYGNAIVSPGGATVIQNRGIFGGRRQTIIVQ